MSLAIAIENLAVSRLHRYHVLTRAGHAFSDDNGAEVVAMRKKLAELLEAT